MERYEQSGDCKLAGSIGEQLQRLRMPYIRHGHFDLREVEAFNVSAETPVDGVSDQYLACKPEKLFQVLISGHSYSSDTSNLQALTV